MLLLLILLLVLVLVLVLSRIVPLTALETLSTVLASLMRGMCAVAILSRCVLTLTDSTSANNNTITTTTASTAHDSTRLISNNAIYKPILYTAPRL